MGALGQNNIFFFQRSVLEGRVRGNEGARRKWSRPEIMPPSSPVYHTPNSTILILLHS